MLDYAIVLATRNRIEMVRACLPLFVRQTRPPARLVIVDSSDRLAPVSEFVETLSREAAMPIEVVPGTKANLAAQRNQGLEAVSEAVTIFPDDDVLWCPDTAEKLMAVYDADVNRRYGAVSGVDSYTPPGGVEADIPPRRARFTDQPQVMRLRNAVEGAIVPQPFVVYGEERTARLAPAAALDGLEYPLVPTIGGYRMSFRTAVAKELGFDELLGSRIGYAVHEDRDMALRVLQAGHLIAAAPGARVFHNVHPGKRAGGFSYGFFQILNYLYIARKVFADGSRPLDLTHRYLGYKVWLYGLRVATDDYNRDVFSGARAALSEYATMVDARPEELADRYAEVCERHCQDRTASRPDSGVSLRSVPGR